MKRVKYIFFISILFFLGCNNKKDRVRISIIKVSNEIIINKINNLFDNKPSTYCLFSLASAVDESVELEFERATYIKSLILKNIESLNFEKVKTVTLVINNKSIQIADIQSPIAINQDVQTISIKIKALQTEAPIVGYINGKLHKINIYAKNCQTGFSEMIFVGKDQKPIQFEPVMKAAVNEDVATAYFAESKKNIVPFLMNRKIKNTIHPDKNIIIEKTFVLLANHTYKINSLTIDKQKNITTETTSTGTWNFVSKEHSKTILKIEGLVTETKYTNDSAEVKKFKFEDEISVRKNLIDGSYKIDKFLFDFADSDFVAVHSIDNKFTLDIKYATTDNFTKEQLYDCPECLLRYEIAKALSKVNKQLLKRGIHIKLYDCYRPLPVQQKLWDIKPNINYVADPKTGSTHNRGGTIDMTLVDENNRELDMGTPYDFFGREAYPEYKNLPDTVLNNRALLHTTMKEAGFIPVITEWWHFAYRGVNSYPLESFTWECE